MTDIERLYAEAIRLFRSGDLRGTIWRLEKLIEHCPRHLDSLEALGVAYQKAGRIDEAIDLMKRLARAAPNHIMAHANLSRFYAEKGMILEAEEEQAEARRLSWKAELKAQKGGPEQAAETPEAEARERAREIESRIRRYLKVIELDPADVLGYFSLGCAYLEAGQLEEGKSALKRAIEVNPGHSPSYFSLGAALESLNEKGAAVEIYQKGIAVADARGDMVPLKKMRARLSMLTGNKTSGESQS